MEELAQKFIDAAYQTTPFALLGMVIVIWWLITTHRSSRDGYVARIKELENRIDELQEFRIQDNLRITTALEHQNRANLALAAAMEGRTRTTEKLQDAVTRVLVHLEYRGTKE